MGSPLAARCDHQATPGSAVVKTLWIVRTGGDLPRFVTVLGAVMTVKPHAQNGVPSLLDVVALLTDLPAHGLARGQVGTVVERLDDKSWLVEFSDNHARAYAVAPCQAVDLLVLHYVPEAA